MVENLVESGDDERIGSSRWFVKVLGNVREPKGIETGNPLQRRRSNRIIVVLKRDVIFLMHRILGDDDVFSRLIFPLSCLSPLGSNGAFDHKRR
jgi:hypothetical protein